MLTQFQRLIHRHGRLIFLFLLAVVIVLPIRTFVAQPFVVDGESMHPTFENGDYLIVDQLTYRFKDPTRGDVIVFRYPVHPSTFYIKRIIGLPGETVRISHGNVTVVEKDGTEITLTEPYAVNEDASYTKDSVLGDGEYFVMGDNRPRSSDSRYWGVLPRKDIMGRAFLRLLPPTKAEVFPGKANPTP